MMMKMLRVLVQAVLRLLFGVRVRGGMAPQERLLIVANHQSFLDPFLIGAFLPVEPVWLVHSTIAGRWWVRLPLRFFPHLVVDWSNPWAIKAIIALLEAGKPVVIFPEGRITVTNALMKIYEGPAFAAAKSGAAVVSVHIEGAVYSKFSRMSGDFPRKWFPRITLTVQPPRRITLPEARTARQRRSLAAEQLRRLMEESAFLAREQTTLFGAFLQARALHGGGRRVLEDFGRRKLSYNQILKGSLALGRLAGRLSGEGERVGVLLPNVNATVALLFGLLAGRRVAAMLNYTAGTDGIARACEAAGIRTVLTSREFLERVRMPGIAGELPGIDVVYLEELRKSFGWRDKLWLLGYAIWFPGRVMGRAGPLDPAVILFTSGSEGRPKAVALSHDSLLANIDQIRAVLEFSSKDKFLSALPLFHVFGLNIGLILPLLHGCRVFLYPSPLHYRVIPEVIYDQDCTILFAPGTFLSKYARGAHPYDFRSIRLVVSGAEKLPPEVRTTYLEKFGIRIIEGYGITECSPVVAANTLMCYRSGTVGHVLPGIEYRLEPVEGLEKGGILHVRGPNVMLGYLDPDNPGRVRPTSSLFGEGWYSTGDIVSMDEAGFVTILGRLKRFAKVAGEMVSLDTVERIAAAASPRAEHAAAAVPETGRGEAIVLFTEDRRLAREALQRAARDLGLPAIAIPRRIVPVARIPVLGSGKKDYLAVNQMAHETAPASDRH